MKKLLLCMLLLLVSNSIIAQNPRWEQVGATQFTADAISVDMEFDGNGKPYLGCIHSNYSATVYKFEAGNWVALPALPAVAAGNATIDIAINPTNNNPRVTLKNAGASTSSQFNVFDFDVSANTWSTYGSNVGSSLYSQGLATKFYSSVSKTYGITASPNGGTFRKLVRYEKNSSGNWSTIDLINDSDLFIDVVGHNSYFSYRKDGLPSGLIRLGYNGSTLTRDYRPNKKAISGVIASLGLGNRGYVATFENSEIHLTTFTTNSVASGAIPSTSSPTTFILKLDKDEANDLLYLMYLDNSYNVTLKKYDVANSTWSTLPISNIATPNNATGFFATMQVNPVTNDVFVAYKDGTKISVKKFTTSLTRIYVNSTATGAGNGTSWANAFTNLKDALTVADANTQEIWVAKGTYKPHASDRNERFLVDVNNLKLYGGFAGTEANLSDRNMNLIHTTNKTILSGDLQGNDVSGGGFSNATRVENSYKIVHVTGDNVTVDGFTITNARCEDVTTGNDRFGAGVYVTGEGNFMFSNNIVSENSAQWSAGLHYQPSNSTTTSSININACIFKNNLAIHNSAFGIIPSSQNLIINAQITNSLFFLNHSLNNGSIQSLGSTGSFYAYQHNTTVNVSLINNTFANNKNSTTASGSDHPVLTVTKGQGNNGSHIFANNIFWGNEKLNNNTVSPAIGKGNGFAITALGAQIRNNIDEDNFSLITTGGSTINTSTTNPNLTTDFKLQSTSISAVNKGDNSRIPTGITKDLEGNNRIHNTTVDIGAYEFGGTVVTCANIVNIPDANFKNALLDHGVGITGTGISVIDTDGDGEICQNEAQAYTGTIKVFNESIADLTGIEAFTSLTELDCRNNQLTSLDISANTALTQLYCGRNQLTSLDVSSNTALTELDCTGNQLTSLDISANTALTQLYCGSNQLTSLDVSSNTALTRLICYDNQLTSLDVSANTALTFLSCSDNQLTSLDVSVNTALTELSCNNNQLTSLNIANGNNANMTLMNAISNPSLTCIQTDAGIVGTNPTGWQKDTGASYSANCSASTCTNIVNIPDANFKNALLNHTPAIDTDGDGEICTTEAQTYTNTIDVSSKSISDLTGIESFTSLLTLYCNDNQLTSLDVSANTALQELYCNNNQLTSLDVSANTSLIRLRCNNNQLTSLDISINTSITELASNNNQLTSLNIANGNNANMTLVNATSNSSLTCIQTDAGIVGTNPTGWQKDTGASYSANCSASTCTNIVNIPDANFKNALLDHGVGITGTGISVIDTDGDGEICQTEAQAYTGKINVSAKSISDLTGIEVFTALTYLNCSDNQLSSLNVSANTALTELYCFDNQLSSLDVSANTALTYLNCSDNQLSSLDVSANTALTGLYCSDNQLSSLNVSANTALTSLYCKNNQLSSLDVSANTALTSLFCRNNQLTSLNIANGNNANMTLMNAISNSSLTCIQTDAGIVGTNPTGWQKDTGASYSANCSASTCTNIVNIPDANLKNKLLNYYITIDTDGDGEICQNEAQAYTGTLDVSNASISNATGLEAFINITELYIGDNNLTSLDVSANTALTSLGCRNNSQLSSLTFPSSIENLFCNSTALTPTSLNISALTNLKKLNVSDTQFTSLNVSANNQLVALWCANNQLTSLTLTSSIEFLFCNNSGLTSLNVSSLTNLKRLNVSNNQLTSLNIANNNNANMDFMNASQNSSLTCIQTDAGIVGTNPTGWQKDTGASYSANCGNVAVTSITVSGSDITTSGGTSQMSASVLPANATDSSVTWSVDNANIATISTSGLLTAVANGTVTVTATANDGSGVIGTKQITVSGQAATVVLVTSITVSGSDITTSGGTSQMSTSVLPANATDSSVTWSVDNANIATISTSGLLTAVANGTVTVTATANDGSGVIGTRQITVSGQAATVVLVTSITVSGSDITTNGGTSQMSASVLPANATDSSVTWSVDDASIATISTSGLLTAVANGTVTVTATANDGSSITGTTQVTVSGQGNPTTTTVVAPKGFSPNGDGQNDTWVVQNINNYPNNSVEIFNRWGKRVYKTTNYRNDWDGTSNNGSNKLPVGSYMYIINFNDATQKPIKGWIYLNY